MVPGEQWRAIESNASKTLEHGINSLWYKTFQSIKGILVHPNKEKKMLPLRIELGTFCVLSKYNNRNTTETVVTK